MPDPPPHRDALATSQNHSLNSYSLYTAYFSELKLPKQAINLPKTAKNSRSGSLFLFATILQYNVADPRSEA
jgi:hypothetical protein